MDIPKFYFLNDFQSTLKKQNLGKQIKLTWNVYYYLFLWHWDEHHGHPNIIQIQNIKPAL